MRICMAEVGTSGVKGMSNTSRDKYRQRGVIPVLGNTDQVRKNALKSDLPPLYGLFELHRAKNTVGIGNGEFVKRIEVRVGRLIDIVRLLKISAFVDDFGYLFA